MFDAKALFKERFDAHTQLLNRYLRYIFNGHFMIALMFFIVTLAVYYQKALQVLPESFPTTFVIAAVLLLVVVYNPLNFFMKVPDQVFLIAKETSLKPYIQRGFIFNFASQLYIVAVAVGAITPLYLQVYDENNLLVLIGLVLILKAGHMWFSWQRIHYDHKKWVKGVDVLGSSFFSFFVLYTFLQASVWLYLMLVFLLAFWLYLQFYYQKHTIFHWERLVENDVHRLAVFYRFVSMFADVPMVSNRVKKRKLLSKWFNQKSSFKYENTYGYLYGLSFIRSNDYLSLWLRLTVLGLIVIYFIPSMMIKVALALIFIYMTLFQLTPLYEQHRMTIWTDLYPVPVRFRRANFIKLMRGVTIIQIIIFCLYFILSLAWLHALYMLSAGYLLLFVMEKFYMGPKMNKHEEASS